MANISTDRMARALQIALAAHINTETQSAERVLNEIAYERALFAAADDARDVGQIEILFRRAARILWAALEVVPPSRFEAFQTAAQMAGYAADVAGATKNWSQNRTQVLDLLRTCAEHIEALLEELRTPEG